ncbi:hypothetical protein L3Y34_011456 [Caenorhabditis briggsae]|uniref:Uncharacterized protein n=1 Tax=Caenorhabditis briggsae TaxID=6238 RepID=A0AAE8ZNX5_CAEBR|nr:hypothetical protein L3Y34_011456 [Caenorhabditis briggsae]
MQENGKETETAEPSVRIHTWFKIQEKTDPIKQFCPASARTDENIQWPDISENSVDLTIAMSKLGCLLAYLQMHSQQEIRTNKSVAT